eukprot:6462450-Amphidinium_carterae.2
MSCGLLRCLALSSKPRTSVLATEVMTYTSSFVPFVQISDNNHKPAVERPPADAVIRIYYKTKPAREEASRENPIGSDWAQCCAHSA